MTTEPETLAQVVGRNARNLRGTHTLEEVAAVARSLGAKWSSGSVSTIELGRSKCTIETLVILALSLDRLEPEGKTFAGTITIQDLLQSDSGIVIAGNLYTSAKSLSRFLSGEPSGSAIDTVVTMLEALEKEEDFYKELDTLNLPTDSMDHYLQVAESGRQSATEERLAKKIGIHVHELRSWSVHLWGKSFESHRDDIAGADSTPQKKGRVSRELLGEIETAMKGKTNGVN